MPLNVTLDLPADLEEKLRREPPSLDTDDGKITVADVPSFVQVLLDEITDPFLHAAADLNCDGVADAADIQPFIDGLLGP